MLSKYRGLIHEEMPEGIVPSPAGFINRGVVGLESASRRWSRPATLSPIVVATAYESANHIPHSYILPSLPSVLNLNLNPTSYIILIELSNTYPDGVSTE
jgi:hypothetical protein